MNQLVSIIIPTFNRAHLIGETLDSVLAQTYNDWECIIVDDGSTDSTIEIINNFINIDSRFVFLERPANKKKGPSSCRNIGIDNAKGFYVLFLDSDDLLKSNCLQQRLLFAQQNPNYDLYIFKSQLFYDTIDNLGPIYNLNLNVYSDRSYLNSFLSDKNPFCIMSVFWVTSKLKNIGGFDVNLLMLEDPDLHINAFKRNLKSLTANNIAPDNYYRKNSVTSIVDNATIKKFINSKFYFYKKHLPDHKMDMRESAINYFRVNVLQSDSINLIFKVYFIFVKNRIFSLNQIIFVPLLISYRLFDLHKIKGLGFYSLSKSILKP